MLLLVFVRVAAVAQQSAGSSQASSVFNSSHPQQIVGGQIVTRQGVAYKDVVVQKMLPDGLVIAYSQADSGMGIAKLKFKDLSGGLQQQFGYNPDQRRRF